MLKGHQGPHKPCPNDALRRLVIDVARAPDTSVADPSVWGRILAALRCSASQPCQICKQRIRQREQIAASKRQVRQRTAEEQADKPKKQPWTNEGIDAYMRKVEDPHYYETRVRSRSALA